MATVNPGRRGKLKLTFASVIAAFALVMPSLAASGPIVINLDLTVDNLENGEGELTGTFTMRGAVRAEGQVGPIIIDLVDVAPNSFEFRAELLLDTTEEGVGCLDGEDGDCLATEATFSFSLERIDDPNRTIVAATEGTWSADPETSTGVFEGATGGGNSHGVLTARTGAEADPTSVTIQLINTGTLTLD